VLPRLPGGDDDQTPLTVDVGQQVVVRARAEGQDRVTEVVLTGSQVQGRPLRLVSNRGYLARALQLGFSEFDLAGPEVPVVCRQPQRTFAWMPLGKDGALPPAEDSIRIASQKGNQPAAQPNTERSKVVMSTPLANGNGNGHAAPQVTASTPNGYGSAPGNGSGFAALIAEAQALREALRQASTRAGRLVTSLKRQRRQQKLAATALASLKQLQQIDG
jgi:hypothetical protein